MKIGILTQPLHRNYGGIIQNWALQQVLRRMGHKPETIFRQCDYPKPSYALLLRRCISFGKCIVKRFAFHNKQIKLINPFARIYEPSAKLWPPYADANFVRYRIKKTKRLYSDIEMRRVIKRKKYDAFIVGSDQVWREEYSPDILSFFLDFLSEDDNRRRIAYAASFGKANDYISIEKMPECCRLLSLFDAVSVREDEGVSIVRNDFGRRQIEKVCDPTLLLSVKDYENIIQPEDRRYTPYIAAYILDRSTDKSSVVDLISEIKGLPVNEMDLDVRGGEMSTISQWLANFADADFVVTDSFHGCVFSIIFGKPFVAIANAERGLNRFVSLLGEFGLSDRLISGYDDFIKRKDQLLLVAPDYAAVSVRIDRLRQTSINFLTNALA